MKHLVLVRHGETEWNRLRRVQGTSDIPLNDTGRQQARDAGAHLEGRHFTRIASSPLSRAHETARIIADMLGYDAIDVIDDMRERGFGEAEGMGIADFFARYGGWSEPVPGGETLEEVLARTIAALTTYAQTLPEGGTALIATHGGVIRMLLAELAADPSVLRSDAVSNGSLHELLCDGAGLRIGESPAIPA